LNRNTGHSKNSFDLEALEPRVLLSADVLLASAVLTNAAHKHADVAHQDSFAGQGTFQDAVAYSPANEAAGIFDGVSGEAIHSHSVTPTTHTDGQNHKNENGAVNQTASVQNSTAAVQSKAEVKTVASSVSAAKISTANSTISAPANTASANVMTQQLTASLKAANAPPVATQNSQSSVNQSVASNSNSSGNSNAISSASSNPSNSQPLTLTGSTDLSSSISAELTLYQNGTVSGTVTKSLGDLTMGGVLTLHSVSLVFNVNNSGGVLSGTVSVTATSANLNLGGAVTSTIGTITGSYNVVTHLYSLTLNSINIAFSSFVNISAASAALTYNDASSTTATITDGTNTTTKSVSVLTVGISNATVFAGLNGPDTNSNAVGVKITGANLALALMSASDGTTYYGLQTTAATLVPVGLPTGFTMSSTNLQVGVNSSNDGSNVVNFDATFGSGGLAVPTGGDTINLDYQQQFLQASGTITLGFKGFVYIQASLAIESSPNTTVNLTDGTNTTTGVSVSMLTIGATGVTIFAGMNGPLKNSDGSTNASAVGVELDNASFALALMSTSTGKSYYGLEATAVSLSGPGLPGGFTVSGTNLLVEINGSNDGSNVVNFDTSFVAGTGLTVATGGTPINLDYTQKFLEVAGTITLDFDGFIYVTGSMAIESTAATVNLTDGTTTTTGVSVSMLTIGATGVTIFAGMNGPLKNSDGTTNTAAVGVELDNASFALALMSTSSGKSYYGLEATAASLTGPGLPTGFTMSGTNLLVEINGSNDGSNVVNFDTSFVAGTGLAVATGGTPINLDYTQKFLEVSGTITLDFDGFIYVTGSMAIESTTATVNLTDGTDITTGVSVSMLTIGATGVTIFAGMNGPSTNASAVGIELDDATFALALMSTSTGKSYYGLEATAASLSGSGLPSGFGMSGTNLLVEINGSNDGDNVVNFDTSFVAGTGLAVPTGGTPIDLDYTQKFLEVSGTITLDLGGFVYITGSMAIESTTATVFLTDGTTTSTTPTSVSMLTIGATGVTIFAGINGPKTNSDGTPNTSAVGIELDDASFALALMSTSSGKSYYGVTASATSLAGVGLPSSLTIGAGDLDVQVNGSNDSGNVVNFDASFVAGTGLAVATGTGTSANLDFTGSLIRVAGSLDFGVADYIHISGGFSFTKTSNEIDINVGHTAFDGAADLDFVVGSETSPIFSATGFLSMTITATAFTISDASLTIASLKIASVLEVDTLTLAISNLSVDLATGDLVGVTDVNGVHDPILTITAASATLFPDSTNFTGSVTATPSGDGLGFQSTFDLSTGAFSITLEQFHLAIGTTFTADASDVLVTYDPNDSDPHQQLVQIGAGTLDFKFGSSDITGNITNLTIYADGFHFDSVTIADTGTISLGSILTITNPSVTLTDFGVTFGSNASVSESGSLTLSAASASLNVGSAFTASATNLSITIALDPADLGNTTITAGMLSLTFGTYVSMQATTISINTSPADGDAYLSVGSATVSVTLGSGSSLTGTATDFSIINSGGSPELQEGANFGVSITATPGQLNLPTWLGFQIQKFEIKWDNFAAHPDQFQLTLSASINSISGLPGGVTVSGEISDAVIDTAKLEAGEFPIVSIGSVGGSVSGSLFGMEVNASFVLGIVSFNAENQIVTNGVVTQLTTDSQGHVTETTVTNNPDTTVVSSIMYVGVAGGAMIPGVGGVQIYIGFSSLGPLTVYLSAEFPLILDPDTGIAIGGFSGGVIFDYTIPTPGKPQDLATTVLSPASITISQWQQQLRDQTVTQYTASGGGTNLSAAYSQPFVIEAGVTLYDAYATANAFSITGNIAIQINPANPNSVKIFVTGTATFGDSVSFNAYLYADIEVSGATSTATFMFLLQEPASTPIETMGGALTFGFTDASGNPLTPMAATPTTSTQTITLPDGTTHDFTQTTFTTPTQTIGGFYISIDGFASFSALGALTATVSGSVTLTVTGTFAKIDLSGDLSISNLGDLATASGELVVDYSGGVDNLQLYGALKLQTGDAFAKLESVGLHVDGAATFELNTTGEDQTVNLPDPLNPHVAADATPFNIAGATIFDVSVTGTTVGTYASLEYDVSGNTVFEMQGAFDLNISATGLQIYADINTLQIGGSSGPSFSGTGLIVVNDLGFAASLSLTIANASFAGISLSGSFALAINTTSTTVVYTVQQGLPGAGTVITIPDGPPQADGTVGAVGPYIVVTGTGDLTAAALTLHGFFRFEVSNNPVSGTIVSLIVDMTCTTTGITGLSGLTVDGAFEFSGTGVVALLEVGGGATSTTDYGNGVVLDAHFEVAFNTTSAGVSEIGGVNLTDSSGNAITIAANTYQIIASGTLSIGIGGTGFVITGSIFASVTGTSPNTTTTIAVNGTLTATVGGATLLTLNASGSITITTGTNGGGHDGISGELALTLAGSDPLGGSGFNFNGTFVLRLNTTGIAQTATVNSSTVTIAAGPGGSTTASSYVEVQAQGNLVFGNSTNGFLLNNATLYLSISAQGLAVSASATMAIEIGGSPITLGSVSGAMLISSSGFAASLTLTATLNDPNGNYGFNGTFTLQVNTTGVSQTVGSVTISAGPGSSGSPAGPYFQMHINGTLALGSTNTSESSGILMNGDFYLTISSSGLAVTASATLQLKVSGTSLFTFSAAGALLINSSGIAAKISLTISGGSTGIGFSFSATFLLEINSTGSPVNTINNVSVNLPQGPYFEIIASGALSLGGATIHGTFTLTADSSAVEVTLDASLNLFGNVFTVSGAAGIYSNGIAINITLSLGTNASPTIYLIPGVVALSGAFQLEINTTSTSHFSVNSGTAFEINVTNAAVYVFGFQMASASLNITVGTDGTFSSSGTLSFNFFGFVTLNVTYNFDSKGDYFFSGSIHVQVGPDSFNIHGTLTVIFSNEPNEPSFEFDVNGGVTAFGISDIISADVNVTVSGTSVDMSVWAGVSIDLGFYTIHIGGTVHIHLGSLATVTPPPPPVIAQVFTGTVTVNGQTFGAGTLLLNVGSYADANRGLDAQSDEDYTITYVGPGTTAGTEDIWVNAPGIYSGPAVNASNNNSLLPSSDNAPAGTIEYDNVSEIVAPNAGASNMTLQIDNAITLPVVVFAGSGTNQFNLGAGTATINGTSGNDTVFGGSGDVTFNAGSGTSSFIGGGSGSTNNVITDPGSVTVIENNYSNYSLVGSSATAATLTYGGNTDQLNGSDISVALTGAGSGAQTFTVSDYSGSATLDGNGNSSVTTSITLDTGNLTLNGNTVTESNGTTGTITLQNINSASLLGGAAANIFTINSWSGSGTVTLDGKGGDDTYNVNFQNSGSFTADIFDSGSGGNDSVILNGTTGSDTINVSGTAVSLGLQTVDYSGIENLTVYTKAGNDTVDVTGTSAATAINTGSGTNVINVGTNTSSTGTLNGILTTLSVTGGGTDTLNLDDIGDSGANTGTLAAGSLSGVFGAGGSLNYSSIENFNLNLGSGGDTLNITGSSSGTTNINSNVSSGAGNDTFNIQAMNGSMIVYTRAGVNTVNIGSNEPSSGGVVKNIKSALTIMGGGTTTLNVDDTGDAAANGTLTATTITGLGMGLGSITYSGLAALNISLGASGNTFTISNTGATATTLNSGGGVDTINLTTDSGTTTINSQGGADTINIATDAATTTINAGDGNDTINLFNDGATTNINGQNDNDTINIRATGAATNVNTGTGTNIINIGSLAPSANGIISNIQGAVTVTGSGTDTLNVDDTGNTSGRNGGSSGLLTSTALTGLGMIAAGITYSGLSTLNISLGSGGDTFNVQSTYSGTVTTLNTGAGTNTVNVTNNAPATSGGVLTGIAGKLVVTGQGTDTLNVNDVNDSLSGTLTQTATILKGLGMGASGIQYSSIETLNIKLGSHNNTIYIQGNPSVTTENLDTGAGTNIISIGSSALSSITTDPTSGDATNTGSVLDNVQGIINITGHGSDTLNVDDSGSTTGIDGGLWSNKLQFLDPVTINFSGIIAINISLSEGDDQFAIKDTITSSSTSPVIVIDGNLGADTFVVFDTHAVMTVNGGDGDDNFYNFGNSSVLNLNGDADDDTFYIYASVAENTSNVDPGGADTSGNQVISYRQNALVNIDGGTGNDKLFIYATVLNDVITVNGTNVSGAGIDVNFTNIEQLTIAGLGGNDTFYIEAIAVPTTIIGDGTIVLPSVSDLLNGLGLTLPDLTGGITPTSFNDTFYVGWQGQSYIPGSLAGINSTLTIEGDNGPNLDGSTTNTPGTNDTVYVDDSGDTANRNFTLTSTTLTSNAMGVNGLINYDPAVENLNISVGAGNNIITINGNDTASATSIYGGPGNDTFIVNDDPLLAPLLIFGNSNTLAGDTLIINGDASGNDFTITGFTIDGAGATISYQSIETLIINAGGATTFTVNGDSEPTYLNGGAGDDTFTVNNNSVPLYLDGALGDDTFIINGNSGSLTATGDAGSDSFTVNGNGGSISLSGGDDNDSFTINGNSGSSLVANGDNGADSFTVNAIGSPTVLNGGAGNDSFTVNEPLAASLTVNGGGDSGDLLTVNGTSGNDYFTIASGTVDGVGSTIHYNTINSLVVNGVLGDDTFLITSDNVSTTVNGSSGNDTFYIRSTSAATFINTGLGVDTVNIGSDVPYPAASVLDNITGAVTVTGSGNGHDTLNIDDTASTIAKNGTLTATTLTGLGMANGITYTGIHSLNILLGSGSDTLNIQSTNATTNTIVNTGAGSNVINIGSLEPALGGIVDGVQGILTLVGSGTDTLNVDDTGSAASKTGILTPTTLTGLGMGASGIIYSGFSALTISLGSGGNTFTISNTYSSTVTTLNSGSGDDTVNLTTDSSTTTINGQNGNDTVNIFADTATTNVNGGNNDDTINVRTTNAATNINTGSGTNTINIGSLTPGASGILDNIQGAIVLTGSGTDTMNVDDTGSTTGKTGTLTTTTLTGLGMIAGGITYSGLSALNISLGSGNDTLLITSTAAAATTVNGNDGDDTFNVDATTGTLNLYGNAGNDKFNFGSLMPTTGGTVNNIAGQVNIYGGTGSSDTVNVDDTGDATNNTGTLTSTTLAGLGFGNGIYYKTIETLNINLGSGGDTFNVQSTNAATVTILNTGAGTNIVNVGSLAPATGGIVDNILGSLTVNGSGTDTMNVDDTGSSGGKTGLLISTTLTGLAMGASGIAYSGLKYLNINLGSGGNTFNVQSTNSATTTTLNTGTGTNTVNIGSLAPAGNGILDNVQGALTVVGSGTDTLNMDDTGNTIGKTGTLTSTTLTGLAMGTGGITYSGLATLNISLGSGNDTLLIISTATATTTVNGNNGDDTFNVDATTGTLNLYGNAGNDTFNFGSLMPTTGGTVNSIAGQVNIYGGTGSSDTVNVDDTGDAAGNTGALTSTALTGLGLGNGLNYGTIEALNISLGSGGNTFTINSTSVPTVTTLNSGSGADTVNLIADSGTTNINGQNGNDIINVQSTGATTNINTGVGTNTVNIGSLAPSTNGILDDIQGAVFVTGSGSDTLNADDTGSPGGKTGLLTSTTLTGLTMGAGGITYSGLAVLKINLGSGNDTFNVQSTNASTTTTLNTGAGTNTINIGSLAPGANGILDNIQGGLVVVGSGTDTLNVDDTGSAGSKTGILTPTTLTGLGMGASGINYSGVSALNISLGSGGNTFTISDTNASTTSTLNSGSGADTVNLTTDSGTTTINGQDGNDTINILSTNAVTMIATGTGTNTVNIGSNEPSSNGVVQNIQGALTITGGGTTTLNLDDTGDALVATGTLTPSTITGLGMGASGITYSGLAALNISLGASGNTFTISNTNASTTTTLNSGGGDDTINLTTDSGTTTINGQDGDDTINVFADSGTTYINGNAGGDTINVRSTSATTNINTGTGTNIVNIGSLAPNTNGILDNIQGAVNVTGGGADTVNLDDTGDTTNNTGTLTSTALTGLGLGTGVNYTTVGTLNINLGSGNDTFNVRSTNAATTTTLNTGAGTNTVNVGSNAFGGIVNNIQGALIVVGSGTDTLNVDDTGSTTGKTGTLTSTTLTGLAMGANGITYSGLAALNISLGSGSDTFTINGVTNSTATTIDGKNGANSATLNFSSGFAGQNLTLLHFQITALNVTGDFTGVLNESGAITTITISGSITTGAVLNAASIGTMTVGGDLAGLLNVTGLLGTLTVDGGTPGEIVAGSVNVITVLAGYGNKVLQVIEGGIEREILATPVGGGTLPGTIRFAFVYDSQTAPDPQLAIRITNPNSTSRSFNLALVVTNSSASKFNLSRVDANGNSGVSNVTVQGDLLTKLSAPELQLFTDLSASSLGGVVLPTDSITGVGISGKLPIGFINVAGIEGLAFGILTTAAGKSVSFLSALGSATNQQVLWNLLGSKPVLNAATDTFVIPFNETHSVTFYAHDTASVEMQLVMTLTDELNDNAPVTAYVQISPATASNLNPLVQNIQFVGAGGSINSSTSIANITSTGALGDITVTAPSKGAVTGGGTAGLGNVTATSIFGNIKVTGNIYGIIQTTTGDIGTVISGKNGKISSVTTISATGALTGQIIARSNLVSSIKITGAFSGVIAAQSDIGAIQRNGLNAVTSSSGALSRFGGISIGGNDSGQIIALGNIFGDITVSKIMTGRITAKGQAVGGLAISRIGILGNINVKTFASGSAIVSGGLVGDAAGKTTVTLGTPKGFVAAEGTVNLASSTKIATANLFQNVHTNPSLSAINAIFTNGSVALLFDTGGNLAGLFLIETDLGDIGISGGNLSGTTP
jgi:hypothetical protein